MRFEGKKKQVIWMDFDFDLKEVTIAIIARYNIISSKKFGLTNNFKEQ